MCVQVGDHFRTEEESGLFTELVGSEPRFQRAIENLIEEHRELQQSLDEIRRMAAACAGVDVGLSVKIRNWIDRLLHHEFSENDLIQDAVDSDFAAAD